MTETERKFLIVMPDRAQLLSMESATESEILQTYLLSENGGSTRVRSRTTNGKTAYTHTEKFRLSTLSCTEKEAKISKDRYLELLKKADPSRHSILKTRITFPYADHLMEIDIYPFWKNQAVLEIELASEGEAFDIPSFLHVIREVSEDARYKNRALARNIPSEG